MYFFNEGNNKLSRGGEGMYNTTDAFRMLEIGTVVSVTDKENLGRIKVRIIGPKSLGGDNDTKDSDLPYCYPLIPKHLSIQPKVGEAVFIFIFSKDKALVDRMYIGPIISQPQQLDSDKFFSSALSSFSFAIETPETNVKTIAQLNGVFPSQDDISLQGRYNTDITQKRNEVVIRAGKFKDNKPDKNNPFKIAFNPITQGFIQIKNDVTITNPETDKTYLGSVTTVMSNKINLISHEGLPKININNDEKTRQDTLITDEEMVKILENCHEIPYGDIVLEYLILMKNALLAHVHNGSGNPASGAAKLEFESKAKDLEKRMLSKNIRIN